MLIGVYAARNILGGKYDIWSVNTEKEYHEEGKIKATSTRDRLKPTCTEPVKGKQRIPLETGTGKIFA